MRQHLQHRYLSASQILRTLLAIAKQKRLLLWQLIWIPACIMCECEAHPLLIMVDWWQVLYTSTELPPVTRSASKDLSCSCCGPRLIDQQTNFVLLYLCHVSSCQGFPAANKADTGQLKRPQPALQSALLADQNGNASSPITLHGFSSKSPQQRISAVQQDCKQETAAPL